MLERVAAATLFGIPRARVASRGCSTRWGCAISAARVDPRRGRYLRGRRDSMRRCIARSRAGCAVRATGRVPAEGARYAALWRCTEVSGRLRMRAAVRAGPRLAASTGGQRRASARQSVGQHFDDTDEVLSHGNVSGRVRCSWTTGLAMAVQQSRGAEESRGQRLPEAPEYLFRPTPARPRPQVPIEKDSSSWHRAVWVAPHLSAADVGTMGDTGCGDGYKWRRWASTCCRCPADACRTTPSAARGSRRSSWPGCSGPAIANH